MVLSFAEIVGKPKWYLCHVGIDIVLWASFLVLQLVAAHETEVLTVKQEPSPFQLPGG